MSTPSGPLSVELSHPETVVEEKKELTNTPLYICIGALVYTIAVFLLLRPGPIPDSAAPTIDGTLMGDPRNRPCNEFFAESVGQRVDERGVSPLATLPVTISDVMSGSMCIAAGQTDLEACNMVHMKGFNSQCGSPLPDDGPHRYVKTTYSAACTELMDRDTATMNSTGWDTQKHFDTLTGVFKACAQHVIRQSVFCYSPVTPIEYPEYGADYEIYRLPSDQCDSGTNPLAEPSCDPYYGEGMQADTNPYLTIVDPDVPPLFCDLGQLDAPCVYVHKANTTLDCITPTPSDKCHRYQIVEYTAECDKIQGVTAQNLYGIDTVFNASGILLGCEDMVKAWTTKCYGPVVPTGTELPYHVPDYKVQECTCPEEGVVEGSQMKVVV